MYHACSDLFADVARVHIIEQAFEADNQIVVLVACVEVLSDRQNADVVLSEIVNEQRGLCFVPAEAGHILDDNRLNRALLDLFIDFVNALTVEVHTADIVVKRFADNLVTV